MEKFDYKILTPFKWFVLENFPFIEADFDALTEWQLFCKLGKEMNKIINSTNTLGSQVENVTTAFTVLQNYVNNYFDNLDIQDEVNTKLNEMAQSGELTEIISQYLNSVAVQGFNTVADMKDGTTLINGSFVRTYGKDLLNDGYGAFYKIRTITNQDIIDEENIISITGTTDLIAEKMKDKTILPTEPEIAFKPKLIGHRGVSYEEPENTIPSFIKCGQMGFWGCETDIQVTSDGYIVCFHDDTVDRMTDGTGTIASKTLAEVQALTIDSGANISSHSDLKIPTFEEYLNTCYRYNVVPVIEIKTILSLDNIDLMINILKQYGFENKAIVISFNTSWLEYLRSKSTITIQALLDLNVTNIDYCKNNEFDIDSPKTVDSIELIKYAHSNGVKVNFWNNTSIWDWATVRNYMIDYFTIDTIKFYYNTVYNSNGFDIFNDYEIKKISMDKTVPTSNLIESILLRGFASAPIPKYPLGYNNLINNRAVSLNRIKVTTSSIVTYNIPSGYRCAFHAYRNDNTFINDGGWKIGSGTLSGLNEGFLVPYFSRSDNGFLSETELENLKTSLISVT